MELTSEISKTDTEIVDYKLENLKFEDWGRVQTTQFE